MMVATLVGLGDSVAFGIGDDGVATSVPVAAASGDAGITKVAHNAAPAVSPDGRLLYVAVNGGDGLGETPGWLLALDTTTLATIARVRLLDPVSGQDASLSDSGTASPTVGPDGDVFFGVAGCSTSMRPCTPRPAKADSAGTTPPRSSRPRWCRRMPGPPPTS